MRAAYFLSLFLLAPALASAQQPCTSNADSAVDAVYRQVLERPAGGEGNMLAEQLSSGQITVRDVVRQIAKSTEHRQRFLSGGGQSGRIQTVTNLYRHLLNRAPEPAGLQSHAQALDRNNNVDSLIDTIIDSPEYQQRFGDNTVPGSNRAYCRGGASTASTTPAPASRMRFRAMDRNGNGIIERSEWNGRGSFDVQDWNRDGILSGDEVEPGARRGNRRADTEPETDSGFAELDANRDGVLKFNEWRWSRRQFDGYDTDRDGSITRREFTDGGGAPASRR